MKKLLFLILSLPFFAQAQWVNGTFQFEASSKYGRYLQGSTLDSLVFMNGAPVNGYVPVYNSTSKKTIWTNPASFGGGYLPLTAGSGFPLSDALYSTVAANSFINNFSGTTNPLYQTWSNTGNTTVIGITNSAGSLPFAGASAYSTVLGTGQNRSIQFATNNTIRGGVDGSGNWSFTVPLAIASGGTGSATAGAYTVFGNNSNSTAAPGFQNSLNLSGSISSRSSSGGDNIVGAYNTNGNAYLLANRTDATKRAVTMYASSAGNFNKWATGLYSGTDNKFYIKNTSVSGAIASGTDALVIDTLNNAIVGGTISASNLSLGSTFTTTPSNAVTLTTTGATNVTLPTSGTLATTTSSIQNQNASAQTANGWISGDFTANGTITSNTNTVITSANTAATDIYLNNTSVGGKSYQLKSYGSGNIYTGQFGIFNLTDNTHLLDFDETTYGAKFFYGVEALGTVTAPTFVGALTGNASTATNVAVGGITGLGSGVATWLATPSSSNLASAVTGETGSGALVFGTAPTFQTGITINASSGDPSILLTSPGKGAVIKQDASTGNTVIGTDGNNNALIVPNAGLGTGYVKSTSAVLSIATDLTSSTYTPTLTNGANVASSTASIVHYIRVGNEVSMSGYFLVTPTLGAGTNTLISLSLASGMTSNFSAQSDAYGVANFKQGAVTGTECDVFANLTTDLIEISFASQTVGVSSSINFSLHYTIK